MELDAANAAPPSVPLQFALPGPHSLRFATSHSNIIQRLAQTKQAQSPHEGVPGESAADLLLRGGFKEQLQCLLQVVARLFDGVALAGDVPLRTERDVSFAFTFADGCQSMGHGVP